MKSTHIISLLFLQAYQLTAYSMNGVDTSVFKTQLVAGSHDVVDSDIPATTNARRSIVLGTTSAVASIFTAGVVASPRPAEAAYKLGDKTSVVDREIASFNNLIYNFQNTALDGGLDSTKIKEPSVSFIEFGDRMKNGEVSFVEFMAPTGAVAYVTFQKPPKKTVAKGATATTGAKKGAKASEDTSSSSVKRSNIPLGVPIRIGQGYPTGAKNSWSSPDYVIRSVSNFGVPYKFTVPALAKYRKA